MSLMNDALRKREREQSGGAATLDRLAATKRPIRSARWLIAASLVTLLTAAAFGGLRLVQATTGGDLLVKDRASVELDALPRPHLNAAATIDPDEPTPPIAPSPAVGTDQPQAREPMAMAAAVSAAGESPADATAHAAEGTARVSEPPRSPAPAASVTARVDAAPAEALTRRTPPHRLAAVSRHYEPGPTPTATAAAAQMAAEPSAPNADEASMPSPASKAHAAAPGADAAIEDLFYQKALAYHRSGRLKDAIALYNQVLQKRSDHPGALLNLSGAYLQNGSFSAAYPLLERLQRSPSPPKGVMLNMAIAAIGMNEPDEAMVWLDRAEAAADASLWDIRFHRAVAHARMNHFDEALALYEASEAERPDDPRVTFNLAITYDAMGRYQEALSRYQAVLDGQAAADRPTIVQRMGTLRRYLDNRLSASTRP